jgi:hypothetical protein
VGAFPPRRAAAAASAEALLGTNVQPSAQEVAEFERIAEQNVMMFHLQARPDDNYLSPPEQHNSTDEQLHEYGDSLVQRYEISTELKERVTQQWIDYVGVECAPVPGRRARGAPPRHLDARGAPSAPFALSAAFLWARPFPARCSAPRLVGRVRHRPSHSTP